MKSKQVFQNRQYVSAMEATWRILNFPIVGNKPAIILLPVHLEGHQIVSYNPNIPGDAERALQACRQTKLTAYFKANTDYPEQAQNLFYHYFPEKFTWDSHGNKWKPRQRMLTPPETVGHLITIHPSQDEAFCLQLLLLHQKGHKTWEDVCTIEGVVYPTYKAACIALDFIENDYIWIESLEEACQIHLPAVCQNLLFSYLLNAHHHNLQCSLKNSLGFLSMTIYINDCMMDMMKHLLKNMQSMICYVKLRQH